MSTSSGGPENGPNGRRSPLEAEPDFDLDLRHEVLQRILAVWREAHRGTAMPRRADITPTRLRSALPHVVLVDVEGEPPRFRWRLIGTHVTQLLGRDRTGHWLDDLYTPEAAAVLSRTLGMTVEHAAPIRFTGSFAFLDKAWFNFESLHLPLVDDAGRIVMLMLGVVAVPAQR